MPMVCNSCNNYHSGFNIIEGDRGNCSKLYFIRKQIQKRTESHDEFVKEFDKFLGQCDCEWYFKRT